MRALILVDLQNDFVNEDGALSVKDGLATVGVANRLMTDSDMFDYRVCTQDYHPATHKSFASNNNVQPMTLGELNGVPQVFWPDHCTWGSKGGEFHESLMLCKVHAIIRKGLNPQIDSYSGFFDNNAIIGGNKTRASTGLDGLLRSRGITDVYVMGLATDYCVKYTAMDAVSLGFNTYLIEDGCRGVNIKEDDDQVAIVEMKEAGIKIVQSKSLMKKLEPHK